MSAFDYGYLRTPKAIQQLGPQPCCVDLVLQLAQVFQKDEDVVKKGNTKMKSTSTLKPRKLRRRRATVNFKALTKENIKFMKCELQVFDSAIAYINLIRRRYIKNIKREEKGLQCRSSIMATFVPPKQSKP